MIENLTQLSADDQHNVETFGAISEPVEATLADRGNRYGDFPTHAAITQGIKRAMSSGRNWRGLGDDKKECLEMIAHKIGRILNGDPDYKDSWHDIVGYAKLIDDGLYLEITMKWLAALMLVTSTAWADDVEILKQINGRWMPDRLGNWRLCIYVGELEETSNTAKCFSVPAYVFKQVAA